MVDYIKILVTDLPPSILEANPYLEFYDQMNSTTGEIRTINRHGKQVQPYKNAFFQGLEFRIYNKGTITVAGSLHKYYNSGAQNYNDFSLSAFSDVLSDLNTKFGLSPERCFLKSLEIGVNIVPLIETNHFLDYCFLHSTKPFEDSKNSNEGKYKQVKHSQYIVKIYNKALHYKKYYPISTEIMRFEIKYTKMEKLNKRGIKTLADLQSFGLHNFKGDLLTEFNNILFYDTSIYSENRILINYKNPLYWTDLTKRNYTNFKYHRQQLKNITAISSANIQNQTAKLICKKIDLLNCPTTHIDTLSILSKQVVCPITKVNIGMQRDNSFLLSHTGLRYYYLNDKKTFEQIKRKYLSKNWAAANIDTQIKEIAHNIRNARSNQKIKQKRLYPQQQMNLLKLFSA
ncbi:hypothetical protein [Flavobacterium sp.]|uniref:hypothetical protein n=1 Tax=Flavobacterium sp. TaxID=239 RepID=UPI003B9B46E5